MKRVVISFFAFVAICSCTTDDPIVTTIDDGRVHFSTQSVISRVNSAEEWESGDEVGISMSGDASATNILYKADNAGSSTKFTVASGESAIIYPQGAVSFSAYYPYQSSGFYSANLSDQSEGIGDHDFLVANDGEEYNAGDVVSFVFKHIFSKLSLSIGVHGDVTSLDDLTVKLRGVGTEAKYNLIGGDENVTTSSGVITLCTTFKEGSTANAIAEAIILPHDISEATLTFTFIYGGSSREFTADLDIKDVVASTIYKYSLDLGLEGVVFNSTIPDIKPWASSETTTNITDLKDIIN
ncbi:MAG: fimbrillin family protein [Rikenellaceae bacterium]